ncbi:GNAT family N-acetyltransferase [Leifsonia sp. NPDC077715]|uniref:GNAT family N-acetyltransferase n=1 Tax=Leifsonia sp. NPDC077715 TaxID=3155539 RepID=UPI003423661D
MTEYEAPRALRAGDVVSEFFCGSPELDRWLRGWARHNDTNGASRTFISVASGTERVCGFYCLAAGSLIRAEAPGRLARNMPDPIPVVLMGRLAVDTRDAGRGLGASLLQHAVAQSVRVAQTIGMRAIVVHAKDDRAVAFYERFGFTRLPSGERTLYLRVADALASAASLS